MRPVNLILIGLALGGFFRPSHTAWAQAPAPSGTVITIAGSGAGGFSGDGGPALDASLAGPLGLAVGPDGTLYFADANNYRIRAVDPATGIISTVAGNGLPPVDDGPNGDGGLATSAQIGDPIYIDIDRQRNTLYLPAVSLFRVRQVNLATGIIDNFAGIGFFDNELGFQDGDGGPATSAYLQGLLGVAVGAGNDVLITDGLFHRLRSVDGATGIINRVAGIEDQSGFPVNVTAGDGGPAELASFANAWEVATDRTGNIFVMDVQNTQPPTYVVRRIDAVTGMIDTIAGGGTMTTGSGPATEMLLTNGGGLAMAVDDAGQTLYLTRGSYEVVAVDLATGQLTPFAGTGAPGFAGDGGPATGALFNVITGLAVVPGGGLVVTDSENQRIRYIAPDSINLVGDSGQTEFHLPWVSALSGDLIITNNPNLLVIDASALTTVSGALTISGNASAMVIDAGGLATVSGGLTITDNTSAMVIDAGGLATVSGGLTISGNTSAMVIDAGGLATVSGGLTISGNTSAMVIDAGGLATVSGALDISGNGPATVVNAGANTTVSGGLTLDTFSTGTLDLGGVAVGGNTDLTAGGYTEVAAQTAAGQTAVTMLNSEATMEVTLPDGAFSAANPVTFSIERLPGGGVETVGGETVTHLETYAFDFAIQTLNSAAELNFEINLVALAEPDRLSLLDLLHESAELTLGVRGDAPGATLQLFDVCTSGGPVADACVVVTWLDENRMLLDPLGGIDPSILRLEGLVGHFSTYSFVAVTPVPEPATMGLFVIGLYFSLVLFRSRAHNRRVPGSLHFSLARVPDHETLQTAV